MSAQGIFIDVLLGSTVLSCWVGVTGMLRMKHPVQSLHYLSLPPTVGMIALTLAVFVKSGVGALSLKTALIAIVLGAINSVVAHATARAFRTRELGHWEPRDGDPIEFVASSHRASGGDGR